MPLACDQTGQAEAVANRPIARPGFHTTAPNPMKDFGWERENWFPLALILESMLPDGNEASSVEFQCFSTFLGRRVGAGARFWLNALPRWHAGSAAGGVSALAEPRTGGRRAKGPRLRAPFSVREHILVVGHRVHVVARFVGAGPWNARLCKCQSSLLTLLVRKSPGFARGRTATTRTSL